METHFVGASDCNGEIGEFKAQMSNPACNKLNVVLSSKFGVQTKD